MKNLMTANRILLGLLMLVPGLLKIFVIGSGAISGMISGIFLFSWAPMFWAWMLMLGEVGSGIAILSKWNLKYTAFIPIIVLGIATLFVTINWVAIVQTSWSSVLLHLVAISNYLFLTSWKKR